jgi:hypothetical protein
MSAVAFGIINFIAVFIMVGALYLSYTKITKVETDIDTSAKETQTKLENVEKDTTGLKTKLKDALTGKISEVNASHEAARSSLQKKFVTDEGGRNKILQENQEKIHNDYKASLDSQVDNLTKNLDSQTETIGNRLTTLNQKVGTNFAALSAVNNANYGIFTTGLDKIGQNFSTLDTAYQTNQASVAKSTQRIGVIEEQIRKTVEPIFTDHAEAITMLAKFGSGLNTIMSNTKILMDDYGNKLAQQTKVTDQITTQISDLKTKVAYEEAQRNDISAKIQALPLTNASKSDMEALRLKLDATEQKISTLKDQLETAVYNLQTQIEGTNQLNISQESSIKKLKDSFTTLQTSVGAYQTQVNDVNKRQDDSLASFTSVLTALKTQLTDLEKSVSGASQSTSQKVKDLLDKYTQTKDTLTNLQTDLVNQLAKATQDITALKSTLLSLETLNRDQYASAQRDFLAVQTSIKDLTTNTQEVNTTLSNQIIDMSKQISALVKVAQTSVITNDTLSTIQTKIDTVNKTITDLNNKIAAWSPSPWTNNGANISYKGDVNVTGLTKANKLYLGSKWSLSGVGDAQGNDGWLRLFKQPDGDYYGGIAMGSMWVRDNTTLNNATFGGGASEHNPGGWGTYFNNSQDNKNYIRGDTEILGNTNNVGDLSVGRNMNVQKKMFFGDSEMKTAGGTVNQSDSYYMEKIGSNNNSHLRLTINDDADESLQIWGNSMQHKFQADGSAYFGKKLCIGNECITEAELIKVKALYDNLYTFTSHNFTSSGAWGSSGPSWDQCRSAYSSVSWAQNSSYFSVSGGVQVWIVPQTTQYRIRVAGARGGQSSNSQGDTYGYGAIIESVFTLNKGDAVRIIVGQMGLPHPGDQAGTTGETWNSGGGGGSFVFFNANDSTPLICAGGGGGGSYVIPYGGFRAYASTSNAPGTGSTNSSAFSGLTSGASTGYGGIGQNGQSYPYMAGAGAGWLSNGSGGHTNCGYGVTGGKSPRNGGYGGEGTNSQNYYQNKERGGFGGGGGGSGACGSSGSGGGGGYTGGSVGVSCCHSHGQGGGSYSRETLTYTSVSNDGHGYVTITKIS